MRVLMISDVYFPRVNGVSTSIAVFRRELELLGHEVTLVAPDYPGNEPEPGILRVPSRYLVIDPEDRAMRSGALRALLPQLTAGGFELLHVQTPFLAHWLGMAIARELKIPVVETYHTFFEEYLHCYVPWLPRRWLRGLARRFTRRQCNELDALVVPSGPMLERLRSYGVSAPAEVIPTGIDLQQFGEGDGADFRMRHGIAPEIPLLLYVGRVAHEKNIGFLLEMMVTVARERPDALLVIAGQGPAEARLRRRAAELGLVAQVLFVGYLARSGELQSCYRAADLFVFASRTETQGLVLIEAMALGVPVVSTAVMGTRDVLRDGEGAVVAEDEPTAFAATVLGLLADPELRRKLAVRARAHAREWRSGLFAGRMAALYQRVITQHAHADAVP